MIEEMFCFKIKSAASSERQIASANKLEFNLYWSEWHPTDTTNGKIR